MYRQTTVKLKESKKRDRFLDLTLELKNLWNMEVTVTPIVTGVLGINPKGLKKILEDVTNKGQVENHPDYSIIKIDQNT